MTRVSMHAEIISIGDELTSGQRLDTNSQWLSQQLGDLGIRTMFHSTVSDDLSSNIAAFRIASQRADLVVITGGLGPTADDLTREALAQAFGRPLEFYPEAMEHIASLFARRSRPMPERNRIQAYFPQGTRVVPNAHGSAPGIDLTIHGDQHTCRFFALPGVPAEAKQMWQDTVRVRLVDEMGAGQSRWFYKSLRCFGIGESDVEARLPDLIARDRLPRVGITVSRATITLRIAAEAASREEFDMIISATEAEVKEHLSDVLFGEGEEELEHVVVRRLTSTQQTVAVIELGAACMLPNWLLQAGCTHAIDQRKFLTRGLYLRDVDELHRWLQARGASGELPEKNATASSDSLLSELGTAAMRLRVETNADWCLAIGAYPEWTEVASTGKLAAFPFKLAIVNPAGELTTHSMKMGGHPDLIYQRLARTGLHHLYHLLCQ